MLLFSLSSCAHGFFYGARVEPSVFTNYVIVLFSIDKLHETNYDTWAWDIKLWLKDKIMLFVLLRQRPS